MSASPHSFRSGLRSGSTFKHGLAHLEEGKQVKLELPDDPDKLQSVIKDRN